MPSVRTKTLLGLFQLVIALGFSIITLKTFYLKLGYEIEVVFILIAVFMAITGFINVKNDD